MASKTSSSEQNKNIIKLNVSGERMSTTLATLTAFPDSVLGRKFEFFVDPESRYGRPLTDEDDAVFIDSDPQAFRVILNYLRRGRFVEGTGLSTSILNKVQADADYFGLEALVTECKNVAVPAEQRKVIEYIQVSGDSINIQAIRSRNEKLPLLLNPGVTEEQKNAFIQGNMNEIIGVNINAALSQGYSLHGNLVFDKVFKKFVQVMVKYEQ